MLDIRLCVHPQDKTSLAYGWFLGPQDRVNEREDVYASADGRWRNCDQSWHGMLVQDIPGCTVVRLARLFHPD